MTYRPLYNQQIACLEQNNLEGLLDQYAEDAVLVRFDQIIRGKVALRTFFTGYLQHIQPFTLVSTDHYVETDEAVFFEATVAAAGGTVRVYDVFIVANGKIRQHFAGTFPAE